MTALSSLFQRSPKRSLSLNLRRAYVCGNKTLRWRGYCSYHAHAASYHHRRRCALPAACSPLMAAGAAEDVLEVVVGARQGSLGKALTAEQPTPVALGHFA